MLAIVGGWEVEGWPGVPWSRGCRADQNTTRDMEKPNAKHPRQGQILP